LPLLFTITPKVFPRLNLLLLKLRNHLALLYTLADLEACYLSLFQNSFYIWKASTAMHEKNPVLPVIVPLFWHGPNIFAVLSHPAPSFFRSLRLCSQRAIAAGTHDLVFFMEVFSSKQ
jgi:hypothetical protein